MLRVWSENHFRYVDPDAPDADPDTCEVRIESELSPQEVSWQVRLTLETVLPPRSKGFAVPNRVRSVVASDGGSFGSASRGITPAAMTARDTATPTLTLGAAATLEAATADMAAAQVTEVTEDTDDGFALSGGSLWHDLSSVDTTRIAALPEFANLPVEELDALATAMSEVEVEAGTRVVAIDDYGTAVYFIEEGQASVQDEGGEPTAVLGAGDTFGEIGLLLTGQRTATVVALTSVRLLSLSGQDFERIREHVPEVERLLRRLGVERAAL